MKRTTAILIILCCTCLWRGRAEASSKEVAVDEQVMLLPYDAKTLTDEQKNANPDRMAYPTHLKESIKKEVDFLCNTKRSDLGPFSVSNNKKVYFSPGNLQYNLKSDTWRFALHQWDFTDEAAGEWIDLFGWGTSGWESGFEAYHPASFSISDELYLPADLTGEFANADWAFYNKIGDDPAGTWRTLSIEEWSYLIQKRPENLSGFAVVDGHYAGMVLLPDEWETPVGLTFIPNRYGGEYVENEYTLVQWEKMEEAGAVFLPAAWQRRGEEIYREEENSGYYWSATSYGDVVAASIYFNGHGFWVAEALHHYGLSVRPVKDIP